MVPCGCIGTIMLCKLKLCTSTEDKLSSIIGILHQQSQGAVVLWPGGRANKGQKNCLLSLMRNFGLSQICQKNSFFVKNLASENAKFGTKNIGEI